MKICQECIVPDSFPKVGFENGRCTFCRNYSDFTKTRPNILGKEKLIEILTSKKAKKYDCLVPLSGGKDSSFILFYIVKELNLKPLAAHFDSGFSAGSNQNNIEKICQKLSVDLVIGKASRYRKKFVEEALKVAKYKDRFGNVCANCENNIRSFGINEAVKREIPFIIWGSTDFEESPSVFLDSNASTSQEGFGKFMVYKMAKKVIGKMVEFVKLKVSLMGKLKIIIYYLRMSYYSIRDNFENRAPEGYKRLNPLLEVSFEGKKVKTIYFFNYIQSDPINNIETLKKEIGWEAPSGKEIRADCKIHHIVNYQQLKDTGITQDGFNLSVLVRAGLLTRAEAMHRENIIKNGLARECQKFCDELSIKIKDF